MNVVVVESPAKAKTINKYLGADWRVLASYGHVRDLAEKEGSVDPDNGFAMTWRVDSRAKKRIDEIASAARQAGSLFLATDPDREGEAISWHVLELLHQKYRTENLDVRRVVFIPPTGGGHEGSRSRPDCIHGHRPGRYDERTEYRFDGAPGT